MIAEDKLTELVAAAREWHAKRIPSTSSSTLPAANRLSAAVVALGERSDAD